MKKLLVAMTLLLPLRAKAAGEIVSNEVQLNRNTEVHLVIDNAHVIVVPTNSSSMSYQVEFIPSQSGWFGPKPPTAESYKNSGASYSPDEGTLTVHTGENLVAQVKIYLPVAQPTDMLVSEGVVDIGALTGHLKALVKNGVLRYDSSALPADACVLALARHGTACNVKESDCLAPDALLRVTDGYVSVR